MVTLQPAPLIEYKSIYACPRLALLSGLADEELEREPAVDGRVGEPLERRALREADPLAEDDGHGALHRVDGEGDVIEIKEPRAQVRPQVEQELSDWA